MTDSPWPQARVRAHAAGSPLGPVTVPLTEATGLTLAAPVVAATALPPFDTAAMDGYAVAGSGPWRVVGRVLAGDPPGAPLADGTAVEIATGAVVPDGAHAVLPVERAGRRGGRVEGTVTRRHIRRRGEEAAAGDVLLAPGTVLTPPALGLAAAAGLDAVTVHPRPRVAALVTGAELVTAGLPPTGRIRDALGPQLPGLVAAAGGCLVALTHLAADEADPLRKAVDTAEADVVVVTGSSSVGRADHLRAVCADLHAEVVVDGVACRPGHPQLLAVLPGDRALVGLPGNPLAALAGVVTVLAPLLAGLTGRPLPVPARLPAATPMTGRDGVVRLLPVETRSGAAVPLAGAGPAMLSGAARAEGFAVVPPAGVAAGSPVEVVALPG